MVKIYWKRILFKTDNRAKYTRMRWRKCDYENHCPYSLKEDFEIIAQLKTTTQNPIIKIQIEIVEESAVSTGREE